MVNIKDYISSFPLLLNHLKKELPWNITPNLAQILIKIIANLNPSEFEINEGMAIHRSAIIEHNVTFKSPVIILNNSFIAANTYFREGVFIDKFVKIGPGTEVKSSIICSNTSLAHLNYIGNSIIGSNVNFEAGSIAANHYNEKKEKEIKVIYKGKTISTGVNKFGSLIGDNSKVGANAVLSPGTILAKNSIIKRLELVEQIKD